MRLDVKWVFFDVGSTLVDETEAYSHRIRDVIKGTNVTFEQFEEKRMFFAKQNLKGDLEAMKYFGLKKTPWHTEDEIPYSDAKEILEYLCKRGYKIGVIANQSFGTAERLRKWGLLRYIDVVAASAELGVAKPDRKIFDIAFEMANCSPKDGIMIGDRIDNDIIPAKKVGMKTIWIKQGFSSYQSPKNEEEQPDYIIASLSELKQFF